MQRCRRCSCRSACRFDTERCSTCCEGALGLRRAALLCRAAATCTRKQHHAAAMTWAAVLQRSAGRCALQKALPAGARGSRARMHAQPPGTPSVGSNGARAALQRISWLWERARHRAWRERRISKSRCSKANAVFCPWPRPTRCAAPHARGALQRSARAARAPAPRGS